MSGTPMDGGAPPSDKIAAARAGTPRTGPKD
ncbi:hypothetical protein DEA8626_01871 [Defluviimonas aquaemixtae]|uniref:Uncharacterized protein n=1 Tax=Albidovulum aquaemixtae TaxID=1542388 RepID=A0A2R8B6Y9_9RHOB|nr:hypothetical protein DEA8626_01871 [Defluviimonas aquaemixtae]